MPPSWRNFAASLKHKRQEHTIDGLIGTLDVEEKALAKDTHVKEIVGASSDNFVEKNNSHKNKKKPLHNQTRLSRQQRWRRRRREIDICATVQTTLLLSVRIAKAKNLPT